MTKKIKYRGGYKYQLQETYQYGKPVLLPNCHCRPWIIIDGRQLTIKGGYAWDGPSGPTIDTENFMRGSLVHDALYQLMREGPLDIKHRKFADKVLRAICREDGMSWIRAQWVYHAVRIFGKEAAS